MRKTVATQKTTPAARKNPKPKSPERTTAPEKQIGRDYFDQYPDGHWSVSSDAVVFVCGKKVCISDKRLGAHVLQDAEVKCMIHGNGVRYYVTGGRLIESFLEKPDSHKS